MDWPGVDLENRLIFPALPEPAVAEEDDATRASVIGARIVLDRDGGLEELISDTASSSANYLDWRLAAFGAHFALHADCFLVRGGRQVDTLLAAHAALHAGFASWRMAPAAEREPSRGPKYLDRQLRDVCRGSLTEAITSLVVERSNQSVQRVRRLEPELAARMGAIDDHDLALFITDNEWA